MHFFSGLTMKLALNFSGLRALFSLVPISLVAIAIPLSSPAEGDADHNWPQWRGPLATGEAPLADPPVKWTETTNIRWKKPMTGEGDSTPIIWGDHVFILSAMGTGKKSDKPGGEAGPGEIYQFLVTCYNRANGEVMWQKTAREEAPHEGRQDNNTFASASPVTDGKLVFAYFGSRGLHCYDMDGNFRWKKDFGKMKTRGGFGEGASPALSGNTIVVNWDTEGEDFIVALNKDTGDQLWRVPRDEATGWSTPLIIDFDGKKEVIVNATKKVRAYDLANGHEIWACSGQTMNAIPSPVATGDMVYLTSGFRGSALQAIHLGRTGELTGTDSIVWSHNQGTPYVPSPLLTDNLLYVLQGTDAILSCFNAKTGEQFLDRERLADIHSVYASPVSAKDRVYVLSREGVCVVLRKGPKMEVLAVNKLDGGSGHVDASMALVDKEIFIRTPKFLYCVGQ
jgi:outer membrane protein assembly factor BamB